MISINGVISYLSEHGVKSHENSGILVVPVASPDEIEKMVSKVKGLLKECGYDKSWAVNPYCYESQVLESMEENANEQDYEE